MPSPKSHRKLGHEKNKKGRLSEKASSFHGRGDGVVAEMLPRPRTVPDLLAWRRDDGGAAAEVAAHGRPAKLTKLLLNVTIQRSVGPVHVLMTPEATVEDLIAAALQQYAKEARRPVLPSVDCSGFNLHYSQFSLESLDRTEKLVELGSRNFFLCPKKATAEVVAAESGGALTSSCSKEADKVTKKVLPWLKCMDFLL
ncbi:hypothetical protein BUALT_Bualt13G0062800 [Buddleja alternifolia]|uniref:DUF7054 domain-containing protein n=1 Tax=Buddleja alternifolia TaxID=168488 RepID=A0AAV6WKX4_9LAMI|nr:hypothetical protein BUALT_Bualt13G0062800 [Buddleja alternifolia]